MEVLKNVQTNIVQEIFATLPFVVDTKNKAKGSLTLHTFDESRSTHSTPFLPSLNVIKGKLQW